ncbi:MAG: hypothetical protein LV473_12940 [Nitrospira sp.]|nr:hypothetical protein [Nitrospira sp.]
MNRHGLTILVGSVIAISVAACADTGQIQGERTPSDDPVIDLLSKGITQLNVNIDRVSKRMNDVRQASAGTDSALQELQALDLSGWELQQRQWIVQRNHLILTRDTLQRVQLNRDEKAQVLAQWQQHRRQYVKAMEDLRQQRHRLESKHLEVEAWLIERGLQ